VISESQDEIVWHSRNPCSLLAACQDLGLDTRQICRLVNEKATQAFVSRINPAFRFHRSYRNIRPYTDHCEERILRIDLEANMRLAIQGAEAAGLPARGAVVTYADQILGRGYDSIGMARNLHAVGMTLKQAEETFGGPDLCGGVLFSTCEPCPRCAALAVAANLTTVVYGTSVVSVKGQPNRVTARQIFESGEADIEVVPGVLAEACRTLYG
jgi:tRNA(Arg) A34 adenosine deaminase TadA